MELKNIETQETIFNCITLTNSRNDPNDYSEKFLLILGIKTIKLSLVNLEQTYILLKDFLKKEGKIKE